MEPMDDAANREPRPEPGPSHAQAGETSQTGQAVFGGPVPPGNHLGHGRELRLHRPVRDRMLGGVAAGLADYVGVDPTIVRVGFVALVFLGGLAVPVYLAGWALIPDEDTDTSIAEEMLAHERARRVC